MRIFFREDLNTSVKYHFLSFSILRLKKKKNQKCICASFVGATFLKRVTRKYKGKLIFGSNE